MTKDEIIDEIIQREAGYVNHPADRGGPTNWGITAKTALAHGYHDVKAGPGDLRGGLLVRAAVRPGGRSGRRYR